MPMRLAGLLVAAVLSLASCTGTGADRTTTTRLPSGSTSTAAPTTTPTTTPSVPTTTTAGPTTTLPRPLLPDQAILPVLLFVDGIVYDLAAVPAREVFNFGQSSLPYAGPPATTSAGLLVASGEYYDATLTLYPSDGGDPVELAHGVGSFVLSPNEARLAWAEPTPTEPGGGTRLVEASFPSGAILHETTFSGFPFPDVDQPVGFAGVVTYVGDNVVLTTGDGAVATAAVWTPSHDRVTMATGYNAGAIGGGAYGDHVVLSQGDGTCGIIASVGTDGTVTPPDGGYVNEVIDCWASLAATYSPSGTTIASAGTEGETGPPILLLTAAEGGELARVPIHGVSGAYFQPHAIHWLDDATLLLLASSSDANRSEYWDEAWGIFRCDIQQGECDLAQMIDFHPTGFNQVALLTVGP
jgi:hypothetical protein